jgi:hypothetical protein
MWSKNIDGIGAEGANAFMKFFLAAPPPLRLLIRLFLFSVCLILACAPRSPCQYVFSPPLRVEPDTLLQYNPSISLDSHGDPCLVWGTGAYEIRFARSTDGGQSFLPSVVVDTLGSPTGDPSIALDSGDNPHVTWSVGRTVRYTRSTDGGGTFLPAFRVNPESVMGQYGGRIAIDTYDNPMIVWYQAFYGAASAIWMDVLFARSYDGGKNFNSPVVVDPHPGYQVSPEIAVDGENNIYVCYLGDEPMYECALFVVRSTDGGATFSDRVWADQDSAQNRSASIAVVPCFGGPWTGQDDVVLAWNERRIPGTGDGIYFSKSTDGGESFGDAVVVLEDYWGGLTPALTADSWGDPFVAWLDAEDNQIHYSCSVDGGLSFLPESPVDTESVGPDLRPSVAISGSDAAFVVWTDARPPHLPEWQVYIARGRKVVGVEESRPGEGELTALGLRQNSPNPFAGFTSLLYSIPASGHTSLWVCDLSGRLVRTLVEGNLHAGRHTAFWNGKDESGHLLPSGTYYFKLQSGGTSATRKAILLR